MSCPANAVLFTQLPRQAALVTQCHCRHNCFAFCIGVGQMPSVEESLTKQHQPQPCPLQMRQPRILGSRQLPVVRRNESCRDSLPAFQLQSRTHVDACTQGKRQMMVAHRIAKQGNVNEERFYVLGRHNGIEPHHLAPLCRRGDNHSFVDGHPLFDSMVVR